MSSFIKSYKGTKYSVEETKMSKRLLIKKKGTLIPRELSKAKR